MMETLALTFKSHDSSDREPQLNLCLSCEAYWFTNEILCLWNSEQILKLTDEPTLNLTFCFPIFEKRLTIRDEVMHTILEHRCQEFIALLNPIIWEIFYQQKEHVLFEIMQTQVYATSSLSYLTMHKCKLLKSSDYVL